VPQLADIGEQGAGLLFRKDFRPLFQHVKPHFADSEHIIGNSEA
jgi:hypothetical protein